MGSLQQQPPQRPAANVQEAVRQQPPQQPVVDAHVLQQQPPSSGASHTEYVEEHAISEAMELQHQMMYLKIVQELLIEYRCSMEVLFQQPPQVIERLHNESQMRKQRLYIAAVAAPGPPAAPPVQLLPAATTLVHGHGRPPPTPSRTSQHTLSVRVQPRQHGDAQAVTAPPVPATLPAGAAAIHHPEHAHSGYCMAGCKTKLRNSKKECQYHLCRGCCLARLGREGAPCVNTYHRPDK